jgi:hypothetical protein
MTPVPEADQFYPHEPRVYRLNAIDKFITQVVLQINGSTEKRSTARRGWVYVWVRAYSAPTHTPLPSLRGYFFSALINLVIDP